MIHGVIFLGVKTMLQKAFTVGSKSSCGGNFGANIGLTIPFAPDVKDQTFPEGTETNGEKPGLRVLYH